MANDYYNATGTPGTGAAGASAPIRNEYALIEAGFAKLPALSGLAAGTAVIVNPSGTGLINTTGKLALAGDFTTTGAFAVTLAASAAVTLTLPAVSGTLATLAGTETLSNKTLVAPALGVPVSGDLTNCTDLPAASIVAGTMASGMTLVAPNLGTVTSGNIAACTGWPGSTAGNGTTFLTGSSVALSTGSKTSVVNTGSVGVAGQVWLIMATMGILSTSAATLVEADIYDGSSILAVGEAATVNANSDATLYFCKVVALSGPTTFTLRGQANVPNSFALYNTANIGTQNVFTSITAVRIA